MKTKMFDFNTKSLLEVGRLVGLPFSIINNWIKEGRLVKNEGTYSFYDIGSSVFENQFYTTYLTFEEACDFYKVDAETMSFWIHEREMDYVYKNDVFYIVHSEQG